MIKRPFSKLAHNFIEVAGKAANGKEPVDLARQLRPDVIIMDISPMMDGAEAPGALSPSYPRCVSSDYQKKVCQKIINAGADSFVPKTASSAELLNAIYGSSD